MCTASFPFAIGFLIPGYPTDLIFSFPFSEVFFVILPLFFPQAMDPEPTVL